jgi:hypothetical protein
LEALFTCSTKARTGSSGSAAADRVLGLRSKQVRTNIERTLIQSVGVPKRSS